MTRRKANARQKFPWTAEAIDKLRSLAASGMRSYEIAAALGCPRNAVMGKAYREGVVLMSRSVRYGAGVSPGSIASKPKPKLIELLPLNERSGAGPAVAALTYRQCSWPVGDPGHDDFHFCSEPRPPGVSPPYCKQHQHLAASRKG